MLVIWGSSGESKALDHQEICRCPTCGGNQTFRLIVSYVVRHIWYICTWVTGEKYSLVCQQCSHSLPANAKEMKAKLRKNPIPMFSRYSWSGFVIAILALLGLGIIISEIKSKEREAFFASPQVGDIYIANLASLMLEPDGSAHYAVMRIKSITPEEIEFQVPVYAYDKEKGAIQDKTKGKLSNPDYFKKETEFISKEKLNELKAMGGVKSIDRKVSRETLP